mmetsp:Transcript_6330/g.15542  ORF Transcript_6330/g.15542 Transcript_6330/m.15542 type:complete len:180 (+) Transcript_6330:124-663(+)
MTGFAENENWDGFRKTVNECSANVVLILLDEADEVIPRQFVSVATKWTERSTQMSNMLNEWMSVDHTPTFEVGDQARVEDRRNVEETGGRGPYKSQIYEGRKVNKTLVGRESAVLSCGLLTQVVLAPSSLLLSFSLRAREKVFKTKGLEEKAMEMWRMWNDLIARSARGQYHPAKQQCW